MAHLITIVDRAWELRQRVEAAREAATAAKRHYDQAQQAWDAARRDLDAYLHTTNR
ncbi:hypothetical protein GCM10025789_30850 [Tessaracoccus lubricantis]|uniref:Uncharacterized protein n=1 Tax=Tessaracoccus lubricantis TaxID=545543 RepID=A0ABP9FNK5_9ACTN